MKGLKLAIELVPSTCWYDNLRNRMSVQDWDRLRKSTYAAYGYKCGVCDKSGVQLHCHEVWEYDDEEHIQSLRGFIALCVMCHHVKHIGLAGMLADKGELDFGAVVEHFMEVNGCGEQMFHKHRDAAFATWYKRSAVEWKVDLGQYGGLIQG